jgi:hypothetical protein
MAKLYIYDGTSEIDRDQADGRFDGEKGVAQVGVVSKEDLHLQLSGLKAGKMQFDRCVIQTHGNSGYIVFGDDRIDYSMLAAFKNRYQSLFSAGAHLYFDGCNVAQGERGWEFLQTAGEVFLKSGGGVVTGFTNAGIGLPGWIPWIGGHTVHQDPRLAPLIVRKVYISYNGHFLKREGI